MLVQNLHINHNNYNGHPYESKYIQHWYNYSTVTNTNPQIQIQIHKITGTDTNPQTRQLHKFLQIQYSLVEAGKHANKAKKLA